MEHDRAPSSPSLLVTGGAGFIGSHLAATLITAGHAVRIIDNLSTGSKDNLPAGVEFIEGDLADPSAVTQAVEGIEVIFHQAALGSVPRSIADPIATERANVQGSIELLEAARKAGVRRVIAASSSSIYGGSDVRPISEAAVPNPRSPYALSKHAMEGYLRIYAEIHGLETIVLRYFNVFGPRQAADSHYAAVFPRWSQAIVAGESPVIYGDGHQSRDFTFVDDVVRANLATLAADPGICDGRAYNVAGGSEYSLLEVVAMFERIVGHSLDPDHQPGRTGDVRHSAADISSAAADLGWTPQVDLESGLRAYLAWYTTHAAG